MDTIVFDKTGTLTKGEFKVSDVKAAGEITDAELLELAALGEGYSNHPIAESIRNAYGKALDMDRVNNSEEIAGHGIHARIDESDIYLGNAKLMKQQGIAYEENTKIGTVVYVAKNGKFAGSIVISDAIKDGAKEAIHDMRQWG